MSEAERAKMIFFDFLFNVDIMHIKWLKLSMIVDCLLSNVRVVSHRHSTYQCIGLFISVTVLFFPWQYIMHLCHLEKKAGINTNYIGIHTATLFAIINCNIEWKSSISLWNMHTFCFHSHCLKICKDWCLHAVSIVINQFPD